MKITNNVSAHKVPHTMQSNKVKKEDTSNKESKVNHPKDEYIPSNKQENVTYEKPVYKADMTTIERLKAESSQAYEQLRNLVRELLERQGMTMADVADGGKEFIVDDTTRAEAQAAIGEGGMHSPENVSDRIVEFAVAISGGDKSKFELLKNAIEEGFSEAKKALGGTLPEVSQKTYDQVMEKLNQWKESE